MSKNSIIKRTIRIISSILVTVLIVSMAGLICNNPNETVKATVDSFYNEDVDSLDYVVLGSSSAQCGVYPVVLWNENQIAGCDLCVDGGNAKLYISMLKEIVENQKNAIIIVDLDGFNYVTENTAYNSKGFWLDSMRKNQNWRESVKAFDKQHTLEHYIPILKYHCNIFSVSTIKNSISSIKNQASKKVDIMHGANYLDVQRLPAEDMANLVQIETEDIQAEKLPADREKLFRDFLDYCKNNNIENVVFCDFPKAYCNEEKIKTTKTFEARCKYDKEVIESYGFCYLNFNDSQNDCGLTREDFADSYHLKYSGAKKLSTALSKYLLDNFEISKKSNDFIKKWNNSAKDASKQYIF